jgi:hypothetical protein
VVPAAGHGQWQDEKVGLCGGLVVCAAGNQPAAVQQHSDAAARG